MGVWEQTGLSSGTLTQTTEQVYNGNYAVELTYDFAGAGHDFVVFWHTFWETHQTGEQLNAYSVWVYGDGSGHLLYVWFRDSEGEGWQTAFGPIEHVGWQQMTAWISPERGLYWGHRDGPDNGIVDYPIHFRALILDDQPNDYIGQGTIYIDELAAVQIPAS